MGCRLSPTWPRRIAGLLLAVVVLLPLTARATPVSDHGTLNCGTYLIGVRSYGYDLVYHGTHSTVRSFFQFTWKVRNSIMADTSSSWDATACVALSDPGTYGYCSSAQ